jgi:hypothetical protein
MPTLLGIKSDARNAATKARNAASRGDMELLGRAVVDLARCVEELTKHID